MFEKIFEEILINHRGKALGIFIGLLFSILVISIGLLETVFIMVCIYIGYIVGKRLDDNDNFQDIVNKIFKDRN